MKVLQVLPRFFQLLWCQREEMETPDDTSNPLLPAHGPGISGDIADTRVQASCEDDKSVIGTERESSVTGQLVGCPCAIWMEDPPLSWIRPFERELPGDLPREDQIIGDPDRCIGQVYRKLFPDLHLAHNRAVFLPSLHLGQEAAGMGDEFRHTMLHPFRVRTIKCRASAQSPPV